MPKVTVHSPEATPAASRARSAAGVEPVTSAQAMPAASSRGPSFSAYWRASTEVGAMTAAWLPEERRREVDLAKRPRLAHETVAADELRGQEVAHVADVGKGGRHDAAHPRGAQPLAHGMDRQDARVGSRPPPARKAPRGRAPSSA